MYREYNGHGWPIAVLFIFFLFSLGFICPVYEWVAKYVLKKYARYRIIIIIILYA